MKSFLIFEFKRFYKNRRILSIILLMAVLALVSVQFGINKYKDTLARKDKFLAFEQEKVKHYVTYTQYGTYGVRMLFVPAPIDIFFINSGVIPDMTSYVDSGERLKINQPLKGKNIFSNKKFPYSDFAGIVLFFGALLWGYHGYRTFSHREFLRTLAPVVRGRRLFMYTAAARFAVTVPLLAVLMGTALLLGLLNGIAIPLDGHLAFFVLLVLLEWLVFFLIGVCGGLAESKTTGITALVLTGFLFLFGIPAAIDTITSQAADMITPIYELELEKLELYSMFEKNAIKKYGWYKNNKESKDLGKKIFQGFMDNEFKKIRGLEKSMKQEMRKNVYLYNLLSLMFPPSFFMSVTGEISSRGYDSLLEFYTYVEEGKLNFIRFYGHKKFYSNHDKVVPFFKGEENVYSSRSRLPGTWPWGVLWLLVVSAGLTVFAESRYHRRLYQLPAEAVSLRSSEPLAASSGEYRVLRVIGGVLNRVLYALFSGRGIGIHREELSGWISVDNLDITDAPFAGEFFYLCHPEHIPGDIYAGDLVEFLAALHGLGAGDLAELRGQSRVGDVWGKTLSQLHRFQVGDVLLAVTAFAGGELLLVYDITRGMPGEFCGRFKEWMAAHVRRGALVLYLTTEFNDFGVRPDERGGFVESMYWGVLVDRHNKSN